MLPDTLSFFAEKNNYFLKIKKEKEGLCRIISTDK
jgi:hypothetical protein